MGPLSSKHLFGACPRLCAGLWSSDLAGTELGRGDSAGEQITSVASDWSLWSTEEGHLTLTKESGKASWRSGYVSYILKLA